MAQKISLLNDELKTIASDLPFQTGRLEYYVNTGQTVIKISFGNQIFRVNNCCVICHDFFLLFFISKRISSFPYLSLAEWLSLYITSVVLA